MNITTATPSQIDARLADIYTTVQAARAARESAREFLGRRDAASDADRADLPWFSQAKADEAQATIDAADLTIGQSITEATPMETRFRAERWTRYYLVTNTGGHVHFTTACGTCFPTTSFAWLTDYSGMSRADFVQEAGALACTVCFPDAPVEQVTRIHYEAADKRAAREAREAKRAAADAAKITVEWVDGRVRARDFKTVRALTNAIAECLSSLVVYGETHPTASEWVANVNAGRTALVERGETYDYDKALAAARKRFERESAKWGNPQTANY